MTIYTTPLQFGYFFALLMAVLFWIRSVRQERLSDRFLGWVMLFIAIQLQDYTFGFAGINFLWNELNGFPREVDLLFGPAVYFYFKTQTNRKFKLLKKHWVHLIPWVVYFTIELVVFAQGELAVQRFDNSKIEEVLSVIHDVVRLASLGYYLWASLRIYKGYRRWTETQFSDTEVISFRWFRNFLYFMMAWISCREVISVIHNFVELNFYQDWWWNLPLVATAFYVGLQGFAQTQPQAMLYCNTLKSRGKTTHPIKESSTGESVPNWDLQISERRLYLQSDLNLLELSKLLGVASRELSNYINENFQINFNDYINRKRVGAFEQAIKERAYQEFTLQAIAYDCGFNSKATFHRAFKKHKGCTPKEFVEEVRGF